MYTENGLLPKKRTNAKGDREGKGGVAGKSLSTGRRGGLMKKPWEQNNWLGSCVFEGQSNEKDPRKASEKGLQKE